MTIRKCEYCGTEFDAALTQCPLCGRAFEDAVEPELFEEEILAAGSQRAVSKPGIRLLNKKKKKISREQEEKKQEKEIYRIPRWMMIALCAILALSVLVGAAFAIYQLRWFGPKEQSPEQADSQQAEPAAQPEQTAPPAPVAEINGEEQYMNEEDYENTHDNGPSEDELVPCKLLILSSPTVSFSEPELFYNISFSREPFDCNEPVVYASSDETVATVNQQGKIVAVNRGSAVISVTCGTQTATCIVTCDFAFVENETDAEELPMELNNTDMTFFSPGEQFALVVRNAPEDAEIEYVSSDPTVATVSASGLITAKSSGTITITVTVDHSEKFTSIVRCNLESSAESDGEDGGKYILSNYDVTMGIQGERFQLSLKDEDGRKIPGLLWTSSDASVCTVADDGTVTAAGKGTAYISTTYEDTSYQCIVRCSFR